jgi:hypothetical protein
MYQEDKSYFYDEMRIKAYIFAQLHGYKNVSIYDFQSDKKLTFALENYKDFSHHSKEYNEYIIRAIAHVNKKYQVNRDNYQDRIIKLEKFIQDWPDGSLLNLAK